MCVIITLLLFLLLLSVQVHSPPLMGKSISVYIVISSEYFQVHSTLITPLLAELRGLQNLRCYSVFCACDQIEYLKIESCVAYKS